MAVEIILQETSTEPVENPVETCGKLGGKIFEVLRGLTFLRQRYLVTVGTIDLKVRHAIFGGA